MSSVKRIFIASSSVAKYRKTYGIAITSMPLLESHVRHVMRLRGDKLDPDVVTANELDRGGVVMGDKMLPHRLQTYASE
jgi:hypothetical protein